MPKTNFCSDFSRWSGEPLAGTAPYADHFVFITWPKRFWGHEALNSLEGFPQGLKNWSKIRSTKGKKITIRLASRKGLDQQKISLFFYPENRGLFELRSRDLPDALEYWITQVENDNLFGKPIEKTQIFVCTHGRHDRCCGRYGQKVYMNLRDQAKSGNLELDVWEASHLGGHRFAGNLMLFPQGHFHGHLTEDMIPAFLHSWKCGRIHAPSYRGHSFKKGLEQVAEAQLVQYCSQKGWNVEVKLDSILECTDSKFKCRVNLNHFKGTKLLETPIVQHLPQRLQAMFKIKEFKNPGACDAMNNMKQRWCWVIADIQILE